MEARSTRLRLTSSTATTTAVPIPLQRNSSPSSASAVRYHTNRSSSPSSCVSFVVCAAFQVLTPLSTNRSSPSDSRITDAPSCLPTSSSKTFRRDQRAVRGSRGSRAHWDSDSARPRRFSPCVLPPRCKSTSLLSSQKFNTFFVYTTPLLGAYIADRYWGRLRTIAVACGFALVGHALLVVSALPSNIVQPERALELVGIALVVMGLGTGAIKVSEARFRRWRRC